MAAEQERGFWPLALTLIVTLLVKNTISGLRTLAELEALSLSLNFG